MSIGRPPGEPDRDWLALVALPDGVEIDAKDIPALAGDRDGDYAAWTPSPGRHTLAATPLSRGGARGKALSVRFTVVAR